MLPDTSYGVIHLKRFDAVQIFCATGFQNDFRADLVRAECLGGINFQVDGRTYQFEDFVCNKVQEHHVKITNRKCARNKGDIYEIGYEVTGHFRSLMEICHNETIASTYYVKHSQDYRNDGYLIGFEEMRYTQGNFYESLKMHELYGHRQQLLTIANILGSEAAADNYIRKGSNLYLVPGQLASREDYIFGSHKRATFDFLNVAPQWKTIKNGNWQRIKTELRNFVVERNLTVDIYTGTHGVLKLNTTTEENFPEKEIFLYTNGADQRVPVPKIFYKVVHDPTSGAGIVFIVSNNPFLPNEENTDYCNDVSEQFEHVSCNKNNFALGYCYACKVSEFVKRVRDLPSKLANVDQLLSNI